MGARYNEDGSWGGWPEHHEHNDLKQLLRHINQRFILEREHCHASYCVACKEEDRRNSPCQYAGMGGADSLTTDDCSQQHLVDNL